MTDLFSPDHLAQVIAATIPELQPGATHVVVGTVDLTGAQVVASFKRSDHGVAWELQAVARQDWSGERSAEAKVILQW
jgi:hypothetical protein